MGKWIGRSMLVAIAMVSMAGGAQAQRARSTRSRTAASCDAAPITAASAFFEVDGSGRWQGFDIDFCKAVATAILGAPDEVEYVPQSWAQRFPRCSRATSMCCSSRRR